MVQLFLYLLGELSVILEAPTIFATTAIILYVIAYLIVRHQFKDRFASEKSKTEAVEGRLKLRDDQLADLRQKMENAPPDQAVSLIEELKGEIAALQPYGLSSKKVEVMINALKQTKADILITQEVTAPDAIHLFEQVCDIFKKADWRVTKTKGTLGFKSPPECGVMLVRRNNPEDEPIIAVLRHALDVAGLDIEERDNTGEPSSTTCPQISFSSRDRNYVPVARWG